MVAPSGWTSEVEAEGRTVLMLLDIGIEIAEILDRWDQDRDLVAEIGATVARNCRLLLMGLRLAWTLPIMPGLGHPLPAR